MWSGWITCAHLVPVDVCDKQDPVLRGSRFWRGGWCHGRLGDVGKSDVPGWVDVIFTTGGANQHGTRFPGRQHWLLQSSEDVVPEQLSYGSTHLLICQMEADARLTSCTRHSFFICITLVKVWRQDQRRYVQLKPLCKYQPEQQDIALFWQLLSEAPWKSKLLHFRPHFSSKKNANIRMI